MPTISTQQAFDVAKLRYQNDLESARQQRQIDRPRRSTVIDSVKLVLTALFAIF